MKAERIVLIVSLLQLVALPAGPLYSAPPTPSAPEPESARPLHEAAMKAFLDGDYATTLALERKAQALEPSPVYLYQIGRALEAMGEIQEAHQAYLTARANLDGHPHTDHNLRELVARAIEALADLRDKAIVRPVRCAEACFAQVDATPLDPGDEELVLEPGPHQVCFIRIDQRRAECITHQLVAGRREEIAPVEDFGRLAALRIDPAPRFTRLRIDGHLLLIEPGELERIHLAPGAHDIVLEREGGDKDRITLELIAGDERPIDPLVGLRGVSEAGSAGAPLGAWITVGTGAALILTSAVLIGVSLAERDSVEGAEKNGAGHIAGISQRDAFSRWDEADRLEAWGWGVGAAGLAAVVGGVVWLAVDGANEVTP